MRALILITIVLASGASAGLVLGTVNLILVEPYLDQAIMIENNNMFASGLVDDTPEFWAEYDGYRTFQKWGQLLAGMVLGVSIGSLFGIVFSFSYRSLPGRHYLTRSMFLAGIMWFVLYIVPFLKYPANLPGMSAVNSIELRMILYLSFMAISGITALGAYKISGMFTRFTTQNTTMIRVTFTIIVYAAIVCITYVLLPDTTNSSSMVSADLINGFRVASIVTVSAFWVSVGLLLGLFWGHFEKHSREGQGTGNDSWSNSSL